MRIADLQVGHFRIPLPHVLSDATHGDMADFGLVTVRVLCDTGEEGLGYTYTVGTVGGGAICTLIERDIRPVLLGADPRRVEQLWEQMWWRLHYVGRGGLVVHAISAVDIALWDLKSKCGGDPLWRLLGGHAERVKAYPGGIDLNLSLDQLCEHTRVRLEQGFRAIKIKVGRSKLSEDVARVEAVRALAGPGIPLMVDANMCWTVAEAIRAAQALRGFGVYWLEEPTIPDDLEGHARVARDGGLPIATGENMHSLYEFQRMIAYGGVSFPEPDVSNVGGITIWMKVANLAQAHNLPVTSHGVHDIHVHLLAAVPNASYLEVHGFGLERFIRHPLRFELGEALAPDRPGHGVELDWAALESHRAGGASGDDRPTLL